MFFVHTWVKTYRLQEMHYWIAPWTLGQAWARIEAGLIRGLASHVGNLYQRTRSTRTGRYPSHQRLYDSIAFLSFNLCSLKFWVLYCHPSNLCGGRAMKKWKFWRPSSWWSWRTMRHWICLLKPMCVWAHCNVLSFIIFVITGLYRSIIYWSQIICDFKIWLWGTVLTL